MEGEAGRAGGAGHENIPAVDQDWREGDRAIAEAAVEQAGYALEYVAEEHKQDRAIVKEDREIVKAAVEQDVQALEYAAEEFQQDRELVLAIAKQGGHALKYAADELKLEGDRDVRVHWFSVMDQTVSPA
eukprot:4392382-Amphidinium_carterae.1